MASIGKKWEIAKSPNYETNEDKLYPYSELPFQEKYKLVEIPFCVNNLIEHVDYYGFGRIELSTGTIGFPNCYNVNHEYELVNEGPDIGRKIPNRVPLSNTVFSTFKYIKDNSVLTVTVNLEIDATNVIQDIVRIVNSDRGKVILYGTGPENEFIADELKRMKQLFYCPIYLIPDNLRLTHWKTCYRAYLNIKTLKRELFINITKGDIEASVILTGCLADIYCGDALGDVIKNLLEKNVKNVIVYAYKLWNNNYKNVVRKHFPSVFQHIFDGDCMAIIDKKNNQAVYLEPITKRLVSHNKASNKLDWKIIPVWHDNEVLFKLFNVDSDMYLQLPQSVGEDKVEQACSKDSKELSDKFYFEPLITLNGQMVFNIFNRGNGKQLELPIDVNDPEDKAVVECKGVSSDQDGRSSWIFATSNQVTESIKNDQQTQSDEDFSDYD